MARTRSGSFRSSTTDLDCDYYGTSLHKWMLAPIGTGMLYVRKNKIAKIWPMMAAPDSMNGNIRKFEEIGTHPASQRNAITEALNFHESIGGERKAERFRYLRRRWSDRLRGLPGREDPEQRRSRAIVRHRLYQRGWHRRAEASEVPVGEAPHLDVGDSDSGRVSRAAHHAECLHDARRDRHVYEVMEKIIRRGSIPS